MLSDKRNNRIKARQGDDAHIVFLLIKWGCNLARAWTEVWVVNKYKRGVKSFVLDYQIFNPERKQRVRYMEKILNGKNLFNFFGVFQ